MSCPVLVTGSQFLSGMMAHIDCQARGLGAYGYGALADPASTTFAMLSSLLAIFIALHGIRLLFDGHGYAQRLVFDIAKIGIVLTIAISWPAWRVIGYDLVLNGPLEVAQTVGVASGTTPSARYDQLQALDDTLVVMTAYGTGRLSGGGVPQGTEPGDSFQGIALADQLALGWGRSAFLVGAIVPFGIARLGAGLMLALAPLIAGLYLFDATIGLFVGWARGLAFCALGSFTQYLLQAVEVGLMRPWAQDVVLGRQGGALTPSAPTELLVMTLSFFLINLGVLAIFARMAFHPGGTIPSMIRNLISLSSGGRPEMRLVANRVSSLSPSRVQLVAEAVSQSTQEDVTMRRYVVGNSGMTSPIAKLAESNHGPSDGADIRSGIGMGPKRTARRTSAAIQRRDLR